MPRRRTAARLLEQTLVVVEPHALDAEQSGGHLREPGREHERLDARIGPPEVERLQERLAVGVALLERARVERPLGPLLDDDRRERLDLLGRGQPADDGVAVRAERVDGLVVERVAAGQVDRGQRSNGNVSDRAAAWIDPPSVERGLHLVAAGHHPVDGHAEQRAAFDRDGFLVLPDVVDPSTLAALVADLDDLEAKVDEFLAAQEDGRFDIAESGAITFTLHAVLRSEAARRFARHPALVGLCRDLLGPDVNLYWDQAVYKKPEKPRRFPWHQDTGYTFVEPQHYLTCWVALTDATVDNGCPRVLPAVHREGTLLHRWVDPIGWQCVEGDPADAVTVEVPAGGVVAFSSLTPHSHRAERHRRRCARPTSSSTGPRACARCDGDWQHGGRAERTSSAATTPTASSPCSAAASPSDRPAARSDLRHREGHGEPRSSPGGVVHDDRALVRGDHLRDDRQPEAGSAGAASPGLVEPGEPLEHTRSRSAAGTPGPSSRTTSTTCAVPVGELEAHGAAGVALGVVGQVPHHAAELTGVAVAPDRPTPAPLSTCTWARPAQPRRPRPARCRRGRPARGPPGRRPPRTGPAAGGRRPGPASAGTRPAAPRSNGRTSARSGSATSSSSSWRTVASGLRSSWLASETNRCWRAPGRLEPGQHLVHRPGQPCDLVVDAGLGHPPVELLVGDRRRPPRGSTRRAGGPAR